MKTRKQLMQEIEDLRRDYNFSSDNLETYKQLYAEESKKNENILDGIKSWKIISEDFTEHNTVRYMNASSTPAVFYDIDSEDLLSILADPDNENIIFWFLIGETFYKVIEGRSINDYDLNEYKKQKGSSNDK